MEQTLLDSGFSKRFVHIYRLFFDMVWKIVVLIPDKLKKKLKTVKEAILK